MEAHGGGEGRSRLPAVDSTAEEDGDRVGCRAFPIKDGDRWCQDGRRVGRYKEGKPMMVSGISTSMRQTRSALPLEPLPGAGDGHGGDEPGDRAYPRVSRWGRLIGPVLGLFPPTMRLLDPIRRAQPRPGDKLEVAGGASEHLRAHEIFVLEAEQSGGNSVPIPACFDEVLHNIPDPPAVDPKRRVERLSVDQELHTIPHLPVPPSVSSEDQSEPDITEVTPSVCSEENSEPETTENLVNPVVSTSSEDNSEPEITDDLIFGDAIQGHIIFGTKNMNGKRAKLPTPQLQLHSTSHGNRNTNKETMDPQYIQRNFTWGMHNSTLIYMTMTVIIFHMLLPFLNLTSVSMDVPVAVVWRMSSFICAQLFLLILPARTTAGIIDTFSRVFVGMFLAFVVATVVGQLPRMAFAHLSTAWASGMFGYSLAEYRQYIGAENGATVAVTLILKNQSKKQKRARMYNAIYCVSTVSLVNICLLSRLLWVVFVPTYDDVHFMVWEISLVIWWILFLCFFIISQLLLKGAIISIEFIPPILAFHIGSYPISVICLLFSQVAWLYFFVLQMLIIAAVLGYIISIYFRYLQLLAAEKRKNRKMSLYSNDEVTAPFGEDEKSGMIADVKIEDAPVTAKDTEVAASHTEDAPVTVDDYEITASHYEITAYHTENAPVMAGNTVTDTVKDITATTEVKMTTIPAKQMKRKEPCVVSKNFCRGKGVSALC